jgi:hypothetical protein
MNDQRARNTRWLRLRLNRLLLQLRRVLRQWLVLLQWCWWLSLWLRLLLWRLKLGLLLLLLLYCLLLLLELRLLLHLLSFHPSVYFKLLQTLLQRA